MLLAICCAANYMSGYTTPHALITTAHTHSTPHHTTTPHTHTYHARTHHTRSQTQAHKMDVCKHSTHYTVSNTRTHALHLPMHVHVVPQTAAVGPHCCIAFVLISCAGRCCAPIVGVGVQKQKIFFVPKQGQPKVSTTQQPHNRPTKQS